MLVDMGAVLLITRCLMLVAISITLGSYHDPSARQRRLISWMAAVACGASLGWAVLSGLQWLHEDVNPVWFREIWPTLFVLCVMIPVLYARGNVAKLLPRVKWLYR